MSITLHGFSLSGHSHRVQLALSLMGLPHQVVQVDLKNGAHKSPEFLKRNPFGQVPVLDDDGTMLFDSNAILVYLATKYDADRLASLAARVHLEMASNPSSTRFRVSHD